MQKYRTARTSARPFKEENIDSSAESLSNPDEMRKLLGNLSIF